MSRCPRQVGLLLLVLSVSWLSAASEQTLSKKCLEGWKKVGDNCYIVSNDEAKWEEAQAACSQLAPGAQLGSIHADSLSAINAILTTSGRSFFWLGLKRSGNSWAWSDGSELDITPWGTGEPRGSAGTHDCVYWWSDDGKWADWYCSAGFHYLCQVKAA